MRLDYKHISDSADKFLKETDDRRKGLVTSVRTGIKALDNHLMDGIFWNRIFSVIGMSGSGKSVLAEMLKHGIIESNTQDIDVLSFELEMLASDQIARKVSSSTKMDFKEIYSIKKKMTDEEYKKVNLAVDKLKHKPIFYVDEAASAKDIRDTVVDFAKHRKLKENDRGLIVTVDHILLTKGNMNSEERNKIVDLYDQLIAIKKMFDHNGMKIILIPVGQLNRKITSVERITNPKLHYPQEGDIFGSTAVFNGSDIVMITHKPSKIEGLGRYGPNSYPLYNPSKPDQAMIYWHIIKYRFNTEAIIPMLDNFANSEILEYEDELMK